MRMIFTATVATLLLTGCAAAEKPQRTALEGFPGITCEVQDRTQPGSRLPAQSLCLNERQWAARANRRYSAYAGGGGMNMPPLYPNNASAQVAPNGNPPPGPAWNPN